MADGKGGEEEGGGRRESLNHEILNAHSEMNHL